MAKPMNFQQIDKKWQSKWEGARIFEPKIEKRKKCFVTFPYPYVNGSVHIGAGFTAFRVDSYARFKRMRGFNVLYPQGFHGTGEPILGAIERLRNKDAVQMETFKLYGATDQDINDFVNKGAEHTVKFWVNRWIEDLRSAGFSIDWRRTFITTAITPTYSRFIEWQYNTLRKKGYVTQGTHPVIWCPKCLSPTGDHDRLEGEGESPIEYVVLKFELKLNNENIILPSATLRPETIYGVVNMWVHPDVEYLKVKVDGETWIISDDAAKKLSEQLKKVEIIGRIKGEELLGRRCIDPIGRREIPILPAHFVDPCNATGIVMSVPSHAPYDWAALKELLDNEKELERFGVTKTELEPISLIKTPGYGEHPAIEICNRLNITSTKDQKLLDDATSEIYKKEFHLGILKDNCGEFAGKNVSKAKDHLIRDFKKAGIADTMWESTGVVVCRCTTKNYVKILENQWFLKFSDAKWKNKARKCLLQMKIYPEEARHQFAEIISWLKDKACTRRTGLGTPLPWDKSWIVETLSDSTIYMAYYTIANIIKERKIPPEKLTDEVFDYVFVGLGNPAKVAKSSGINVKILKEMKAEFEYWYPVDMRNSGKDLVPSHLTFFIFHHVAMWDKEEYWPKAIGVNGFVQVHGTKMSKSKGNIIPLRELVKNLGSDLVRINIIGSNEEMNDADWRDESLASYRTRIQFLYDLVSDIKNARRAKPSNVDRFLLSRVQKTVSIAETNYEKLKFRSVSQRAFFDTVNDLKWYLDRCGDIKNCNKKVLKDSLNIIIRLLAPLLPHVCEELWQDLRKKQFVALADFPKENKKLIDENAEKMESLVRQTLSDVKEISKIVKIKAKKVNLYVVKNDELGILKDAEDFLEKALSCKVNVQLAKESKSEKAKRAKEGKPGIELV